MVGVLWPCAPGHYGVFARKVTTAIFAALWLVSAGVPSYGQVLCGCLVGNVSDQSGSIVPGAKVTVRNQSTNFSRAGSTDATGGYSFPALPPCTYAVTISATGFQDQKSEHGQEFRRGGAMQSTTTESADYFSVVSYCMFPSESMNRNVSVSRFASMTVNPWKEPVYKVREPLAAGRLPCPAAGAMNK